MELLPLKYSLIAIRVSAGEHDVAWVGKEPRLGGGDAGHDLIGQLALQQLDDARGKHFQRSDHVDAAKRLKNAPLQGMHARSRRAAGGKEDVRIAGLEVVGRLRLAQPQAH